MDSTLTSLTSLALPVMIVVLLIALLLYVLTALLLSNLNKLMYGKGTWMAWVPLTDIYLLGKLTVNKWVGWLLVVLSIVTSRATTTVNGVTTEVTLIPGTFGTVLYYAYGIASLVLFIYAIVKYNKLKKEAK